MADARRELLELETRRHEAQLAELAAAQQAVDAGKAELQQRVASEDMARQVLGRLQQPSAQQAVVRLAGVIQHPRRD
jgi:hypothetical protein